VDPAGTIDVLDTHRFDVAALERYLRGRIAGFSTPIVVRQFRGGQSNPTYYLNTSGGTSGTAGDTSGADASGRSEADASARSGADLLGPRAYVLRRKPPGQLLPSAHAIDREYRVITALKGSGVPVPNTYLLCEDPGVIGTPFFLMEYVAGHPMTDATLPDRSPAGRSAIYESMISVLARLHTVDWRAAGLAGYGKPGNYVARQIHRWTAQYRASETAHIEAMERLIEWLPAHIPAGDENALVHGDYRPGNLLLHPREPRVAAVIDWELSTLGHPLVDLGHHALIFRTDPEDFGSFADRARPEGIPSEEEHLETYCGLTGRASLPEWDFYVAFAMFRFAAIFQGIMGRVVAGTANDPDARRAGSRARPLAERAWRLIESRY
jgi:aminoglycoside phosphotransferase (APT) family kinase protein